MTIGYQLGFYRLSSILWLRRFACWGALFFLFGVIACGTREPAGMTVHPVGPPRVFVVLSVENKTNAPEWQNHLIAIGLRNLINEELYATGQYIPADVDPQAQAAIDALVRKSWQGQTVSTAAVTSGSHKATYDTEVRATVKSFTKSRSRLRLGPFSSNKMEIQVVVALAVRFADGTVKHVEGVGQGTTEANGVFFTLRKGKAFFDESTVGIAAHEAVREAVRRLLE